MILLKSEKDLSALRVCGKILARILRQLQRYAKSGVSTQEIDSLAEELIRKENAVSAFKGYRGFPANICTSINEEIVHGIPGDRKLKEGDILSIDAGISYQGYFSDAAVTIAIGRVNPELKKLIKAARNALLEGIKKARAENHLSDISFAIQSYVEKQGFSVVREFVGHGVGFSLHEEPEVPNFGLPGEGCILKKGMVLAIEPMINLGGWESQISPNGWTALTKDGLASSHFEHTIAITDRGAEILTN